MYCLLRNICSRNSQLYVTSLTQKRFAKIRSIAPAIMANETFEEKNARLARPLSPHLTIYKYQITMLMSISHRIAGLALCGYLAAYGAIGYFDYTDSIVLYIRSLELSPATWYSLKTLFLLPFSYHFANGIRHLLWDTGASVTNKGVNTTGYTVLVGTVVISLLIASLKMEEK